MVPNKKAKVIATVGPASNTPSMLRRLAEAGVDTFRLNFSHGDHETHKGVIGAIRELEGALDRPVGILQDLQGPKIRLGRVHEGKAQLSNGQIVQFIPAETSDDVGCLPLPHPEIFAAIKPGHQILINDGQVRLTVTSSSDEIIDCKVIVGGTVTDRKGVNLPDTVLDLPVLTEKDRHDLEFGLKHGVDWVALSFVQNASDLDQLRALIEGKAGLVAKIEKPSALLDLENIIQKSDALMVARGDLGVEIPPEEVPANQKEIISLCRAHGKPVIVATQMLESMISSPTPTRAEASDVATAIYDGADAVMLSAESAAGSYPAEAVAMMNRIIVRTEQHGRQDRGSRASAPPRGEANKAVAGASTLLSEEIGADAIVAFTTSGATALCLAAQRPCRPLVAITPSVEVARRLCLAWGIQALVNEEALDHENVVDYARHLRLHREQECQNSRIIVVSGSPFGQPGSTNNIRVAEL
ncbi:pyruvate kinase [Roseibium sp.]|uniref:pyruvate kinase n=1 Tax=Roseibium sp. TaxID=1936156 RepID=UPI003A97FE4E